MTENQRATDSSGWTVGTLKTFLLDKINGNDARYDQRFKSQEDAVKAALNAQLDARKEAALVSEKRLEGLNELRKMAEDQQKVHAEYTKTYMPRMEAMAEVRAAIDKVDATNKRVEALTARVDMLAGEKVGAKEKTDDTKWFASNGIALVAAALAFAALILPRLTNERAPTQVAAPAPAPQVIYVPAPAGSLLPTTPPQAAPR